MKLVLFCEVLKEIHIEGIYVYIMDLVLYTIVAATVVMCEVVYYCRTKQMSLE